MTTDFVRALYGWACERLYHEFAWCYDIISWLVSGGRWDAWRRMVVDYVRGPVVLELGFGTGELLRELTHHASAVYGIDLSPAMHRVTQKKIQRRSRESQVVTARERETPNTLPMLTLANAQFLPLASASVDTIVSTFPAPYILEQSTLRECTRILGATGRLVVLGMWVTPRQPQWLRSVPVFFGAPSDEQITFMAEQFRTAGLEPRFEMVADRWADVSVVIAEPIL